MLGTQAAGTAPGPAAAARGWSPAARCRKTYNDGIYTVAAEADDHGYALATATIKDDKITAVQLKAVTDKNVFKDYAKYPYKKSVEAHDELPAKFVETNGRPVDTFTGATHSTAAFNAAVASALELAEVK